MSNRCRVIPKLLQRTLRPYCARLFAYFLFVRPLLPVLGTSGLRAAAQLSRRHYSAGNLLSFAYWLRRACAQTDQRTRFFKRIQHYILAII